VESNSILATYRELGITFVAYSPLGRGFLTGAIQKLDDLDANDWRRTNPRFQEEALKANLKPAETAKEIAARKGCTAGSSSPSLGSSPRTKISYQFLALSA